MAPKLRAGWWWIDRWRKSTAFTDMTLAEQGAYRNLLDELWLRDGLLPLSERSLSRACGDPTAWCDVRDAVMAHFVETPEGWRNETHDAVHAESKRKAKNQQSYRERKRQQAGNVTGNVTGNVPRSPSPSPSPDQSPSPSPNDLEEKPTVSCRVGTRRNAENDICSWFLFAWNDLAGALPKIRSLSKPRVTSVKAMLGLAQGDRDLVEKAISAFASWAFAIEKGLGVDTFLRANKRDQYLEWATNGPPGDNGSASQKADAAIMEYAKRRFGDARNLD